MLHEILNFYKNRENKTEEDLIYIRSCLDLLADVFRTQEKNELLAKTFYEGFKFSEGNLKAYCAYRLAQQYFQLMKQPEKAEKYYKFAYMHFKNLNDNKENFEFYLRSMFLHALCLKRRNAKQDAFGVFKRISQEFDAIYDVKHYIGFDLIKEAVEFLEGYAIECTGNSRDDEDILKFYKKTADS